MKFCKDESGNVVIEFVATAVALFIPIAYIGVATLQVATSYIEVQNTARSAARVFVTSSNEVSARVKSNSVIKGSLAPDSSLVTSIICSANPCLSADAIVRIEISRQVELNLPSFLGRHIVTVNGDQAEMVQTVQ